MIGVPTSDGFETGFEFNLFGLKVAIGNDFSTEDACVTFDRNFLTCSDSESVSKKRFLRRFFF